MNPLYIVAISSCVALSGGNYACTDTFEHYTSTKAAMAYVEKKKAKDWKLYRVTKINSPSKWTAESIP